MPVAIRIEIIDPDLLTKYAELIADQANGAKNTTAITTNLEEIIAKTIFKGTKVNQLSNEVSNPDWSISHVGMLNLINELAGESRVQGANYIKYVRDRFKQYIDDAPAVGVEGKFLRNDDRGDVKIGTLTLLPTSKETNIKYFDFDAITPEGRGGVIDTTRGTIVDKIKQNMFSPPTKENLQPIPDKPKYSKELKMKGDDEYSYMNKKIFTDYLAKVVPKEDLEKFKAEPLVSSLAKKLANVRGGNLSGKTIEAIIETLNDTLIRSSALRHMRELSKSGNLFDYIMTVPALKTQFYNKSKGLMILRLQDGKVNANLITFSSTDFTSKFFGAKLSEGVIAVYLKSHAENMFNTELGKQTALVYNKATLAKFEEAVAATANKGNKITISNYFGTEIQYLVPTGGSIPMSRAKYKIPPVKPKYTNADFTFKNRSNANADDGKYRQDDFQLGTFLSSEYLRLLVIKNIVNKMPEGPVGGRPLSNQMLTYRTGVFANSLKLIINYRTATVQYYYNPIYFVHEKTSRNPKNLIRGSISEVLASRFKQHFNITKMGDM